MASPPHVRAPHLFPGHHPTIRGSFPLASSPHPTPGQTHPWHPTFGAGRERRPLQTYRARVEVPTRLQRRQRLVPSNAGIRAGQRPRRSRQWPATLCLGKTSLKTQGSAAWGNGFGTTSSTSSLPRLWSGACAAEGGLGGIRDVGSRTMGNQIRSGQTARVARVVRVVRFARFEKQRLADFCLGL